VKNAVLSSLPISSNCNCSLFLWKRLLLGKGENALDDFKEMGEEVRREEVKLEDLVFTEMQVLCRRYH